MHKAPVPDQEISTIQGLGFRPLRASLIKLYLGSSGGLQRLEIAYA